MEHPDSEYFNREQHSSYMGAVLQMAKRFASAYHRFSKTGPS